MVQQDLPTVAEETSEELAKLHLARLREITRSVLDGQATARQAASARDQLVRGMCHLGFVDFVFHVERFMRATGQHAVSGEQDEAQAMRHWKMVERKHRELEQAFFAEDGEGELNAGIDLLWAVIGMMVSQGHDVRGAFMEVNRANEDKEPPTGQQPVFNKHGFIAKPEGWRAPQLAEFVGW
jgi:hypothetical protein